MSINKHLRFHRRFAGREDEKTESPLSKIADRLVEAHAERENDRLVAAEDRAVQAGHDATIDAVTRFERRNTQASWNDDACPAVMKFDLYEAVKDASKANPTDRGLKTASLIVYNSWSDDVSGTYSLAGLRNLSARIAQEQPKTKIGAVIDNTLAKVGFNTLKDLPGLARVASRIESQDQYDSTIAANGLDGPENIRARAFIRALLEMSPENSTNTSTESTVDRIATRLAQLGMDEFGAQPEGQDEPDMSEGVDNTGEPAAESSEAVEPDMPPHDEVDETSTEIESPVSGETLVLELGVAEPEGAIDGMEPESIGEEHEQDSGAPMNPMGDGHGVMANMSILGQLSDMVDSEELETPNDLAYENIAEEYPEDMAGVEIGDSSSSTVIDDPSSGEKLRITIEPVQDELESGMDLDQDVGEGDHGLEMAGAGDMELCAEHNMPMDACMSQHGDFHKEGPDMEHEAGANEDEIGNDMRMSGAIYKEDEAKDDKNPWAVDYDKMKNKLPKSKSKSKKSYKVYATIAGETSDEPMDSFTAYSMRDALKRVSSFGVDGQVLGNVDTVSREAYVLLGAARGDWLHITADAFAVPVAPQPGNAVNIPEDGAKALRSNGVSESDGSGATGKKPPKEMPKPKKMARAISRDEIVKVASNLGIDAVSVESNLLNGEPVQRHGWTLKVNASDEIELYRNDIRTRTASILNMDNVIADFQAGVVASVPDVSIRVAELFQLRCAQCKSINEYVMPESATDLNCDCGFVAKASALTNAFAKISTRSTSDYILTIEVPPGKGDRDFKVNAKRIANAVRQVVASAEIASFPEVHTAEVVLRNVEASAVNRIERVVNDVFGSRVTSKSAQYVGKTPAMESRPGLEDPSMQAPMQTVDTQPGAQKDKMQNALDPLQPGKMGPTAGAGDEMEMSASDDEHMASNDPEMLHTAQMLMMADEPKSPMDGPADSLAIAEEPMSGDMPSMEEESLPGAGDEGGMAQPLDAPMGDPNSPISSMAGDVLDPEGKDAANSALLHYRNQGMGVLDALAEFKSQYSDFIDGFGEDASPERHLAEAEVVRIAGEVYSKPALIQRAAAMVEKALSMYASIFDAGQRLAFEAPKVNKPKPKVKVSPPGPDSSDKEPNFGPKGKSKSQAKPQGKHPDPKMAPDTSDAEPNFGDHPFGSDAQAGSRAKQKGTSYPNTSLGKDSDTAKNGIPTPGVSKGSQGK